MLPLKEDAYYFSNGSPIKSWTCTSCGNKGSRLEWSDKDLENKEVISCSPTLGFNGPNGNGYNYFCRKCEGSVKPDTNPYSALDNFFAKL